MHHHEDDHDRGLSHDLPRLLDRRRMLGLLGGAVLLGTAACAAEETPASPASAPAAPAAGEIPDETAGPYPADGSNGPDVLTESGVVRSDIRSSFGSASGTAEGVPVTVELTVTDGGAPYRGAAVYVWHCDREGRYSLYSAGATEENYLRGVQEADKTGKVRFVTIFPGSYPGRWPHIHFEVYATLAKATASAKGIKTSQLAFPEAACAEAYTAPGYERSAAHLARSSLAEDGVFADGHSLQLATVTGDPESGYTARLNVPV
ncbi:dioxygenase family protein [Actinocorallia populi]|uniref:dioxygenase family protein n=1 Tax=Actinocorallia populi TaxID=2079200 RepID=UPI000D088777|nr:intradiol ring-cleavage dioxygenase [Actinocorallia populi]